MARKENPPDIVKFLIMTEERIRSRRLFVEAFRAAVPELKASLQDSRKAIGWWRLELYPNFPAPTNEDLVAQATAWAEDAIPRLKAQGLEVIHARVKLRGSESNAHHVILLTDKYFEASRKAQYRRQMEEIPKLIQQPMQPHEIESLTLGLLRAVGQGIVRVEDEHTVKDVTIASDGTHTTIVLTI